MSPPRTHDSDGSSCLSSTSTPRVEQSNSETSIFINGTASEGFGPPIGVVDIGVSSEAYLFRVALPGVDKDHNEFSCVIEHDGMVQLQGVTVTGQRTVFANSCVFQMKSQRLCPPGPFTISFSLPGPVDPRLVQADFGSDGIFEAVVMKCRVPGDHSHNWSTKHNA